MLFQVLLFYTLNNPHFIPIWPSLCASQMLQWDVPRPEHIYPEIRVTSMIISEGYPENASLLSEINVLTKEASRSIQMPCPKAHHLLRLQREPPQKLAPWSWTSVTPKLRENKSCAF